jgi:hypothetical protein
MTVWLDEATTIELLETGSASVTNTLDGVEYKETIKLSDVYFDNTKPAANYFLTTNLGFSYALCIPEKYKYNG